MTELNDLEQRLRTALHRIEQGLQDLPEGGTANAAAADDNALQGALDDERIVTAQLTERLRAVKEKNTQTEAALAARIEQMAGQLDAQGAELRRMRNANVHLREVLRLLREASSTSLADPHLLNRSMQAELEALRSTRMTEIAEMDEILAELAPMIEEVRENA